MKKVLRFAAAALPVLTAIVLLFSCTFVLAHTDHDCIGADCPVCARIEACLRVLDRLGAATIE